MSQPSVDSGFKKYRKKPIVIQAKEMSKPFSVQTKEGVMSGKAGDFLLIGIKGERYPCDRDIFFATYEKASRSLGIPPMTYSKYIRLMDDENMTTGMMNEVKSRGLLLTFKQANDLEGRVCRELAKNLKPMFDEILQELKSR